MHPLEMLILVLRSCDASQFEPNRTQLQKIVYFCRHQLHLEPLHSAHYYGPYSAEVAEALRDLVGLGFVQEGRETFSNEEDMNEIIRYSYCLSKHGAKMAKEIAEESGSQSQTIHETVCAILRSGVETEALANAAKVHYILRGTQRAIQANRQEVSKQASRLGWRLTGEQIDVALDYLDGARFL